MLPGVGGKISSSTAPRGFTEAWFGSDQASSPCKGVQCCCRAGSKAAWTSCQDCALRHHQHPDLNPVPELGHCTLQQAPGTSPALSLLPSAALGSACLPAPGLHHCVPHSKKRLARSSCSTERWGHLASSSSPHLSIVLRTALQVSSLPPAWHNSSQTNKS